MSETVITADRLSKRYRIGRAPAQNVTWKERLAAPFRYLAATLRPEREDEILWALKDVSFEVKQGEVLGIIGRNGAGKSTLLKLLSRITEPTSGRAVIRGRVGSLLEVGTGFHQELTGRENIYMSGAILGMRQFEIARKFDEIVDFAGVERFLDTPVKRYSSGMYVRLGFAVAAHLEPEVLLIDEVLAVGDAEFQKKCLGKMGDVAKGGRTILFVSHNLGAVERLCRNSLVFHSGTLRFFGETEPAIQEYLALMNTDTAAGAGVERHQDHPDFALHSLVIGDTSGAPQVHFRGDQEILLSLNYEVLREIKGMRIVISVLDRYNTVLFSSSDCDHLPENTQDRHPGKYLSVCKIPAQLLNAGQYWVAAAADIPMKEWILKTRRLGEFQVSLAGAVGSNFSDNRRGLLRPLLDWQTSSLPSLPF